MAKEAQNPKKKLSSSKRVTTGVVHVLSTFNNTVVTITDPQGNVIAWSSAGSNNFKGSRKATPYAAQVTAEIAGRKAQDRGLKVVSVEVRGPGAGRESALRALQALGLTLTSIKDVTKLPHNGCRPRKRRRV